MRMKRLLVMTMLVAAWPISGRAQTGPKDGDDDLARMRYQIGQMERVLEGAVDVAASLLGTILGILLAAGAAALCSNAGVQTWAVHRLLARRPGSGSPPAGPSHSASAPG